MDRLFIFKGTHVINDALQYQVGKELEVIKFGVEVHFADGKPILKSISMFDKYELQPGDWIIKIVYENRNSYEVMDNEYFVENTKCYEVKEIDLPITDIQNV